MTGRRDHDGKRRDEAFVRDVLARTSGSPCARAEQQLPALIDGELAGLDRQLVQAHLEHCPGCRAVAVVLGWMGPQLPALAELDPGPAFTDRVLAATSRRRQVAVDVAGRPHGLAGVMDRLGRWWQGRILQPGFAFQAAYVATVVLVLLTAVPGAPLRGVPDRALATFSHGPQALPVVGGALSATERWCDGLATSTRNVVDARWDTLTGGLDRRDRRADPARHVVDTHLRDFWQQARAGRLGEAGYELLGAARAGRDAWRLWWRGESAPATAPDRDSP